LQLHPALRRRVVAYPSILLVVALSGTMLRMGSFVESWVFYFPSREAFITPSDVRDVSIPTLEGHSLHAWVTEPEDQSAPVILHLHGNAGNIETHAEFSAFLAAAGFRVVLLDYRGYGRSERAGRPTRERLFADSQSALDWMRSQDEFKGAPIGVYGVSLGGAMATALAGQNEDVRALCTVSAFSSWQGVARDHAPVLGSLLIGRGLDPVMEIAGLSGRPVLLIHGGQDAIVPVHHLERIASAGRKAGARVETALIPLGSHNDVPFAHDEAREAVTAFFRTHLARP
jgi:dipeptidyl aminopeptidase/acylaminoacyl peptidase